MAEFETLPVDALPEGALFLDVREDYEWEEGHIAGALHIPLDDLPVRCEELDPDQDLLLICRSGGRSFRAAQWLTAQGYSVTNVAGGMGAWQDAELPMVSENGQAPQVR
ncbi:rhodanese-like domain-containing protein [Psychromicrobium xiongbiense]|uniref:rhodanese-like domain-containing protein n=1 Tax=Psychromicrobium xiongbiense TaxID=3051184 RepID=UPI002555FC73|nr:rhodanese-like domain-containing protein [Psychromicrobium sp. YIM S02556]